VREGEGGQRLSTRERLENSYSGTMEDAQRYADDVATILGFARADHEHEAKLLLAAATGGEPYDWQRVNHRVRRGDLRDQIAKQWPEKSEVERAAILGEFGFPG